MSSSSSSSAAAAASPPLRAPLPQMHHVLMADDDDDSEVPAVRIESSRVVDQTAIERLTCCAHGPGCEGYVPMTLVTLNCRHALCLSCYNALATADLNADSGDDDWDPELKVKCPTCRVVAPPHARSTNHGLMGLVESLMVRCKHSPACNCAYPLGTGFRGEAEHLAKCPREPVDPCEGCGMALVRIDAEAHRAICNERKEECTQCGEFVRASTKYSHVNGGEWEDWCAGMLPCPYGCEEQSRSQPSAKARKLNQAGDKDNGLITRLKPSDLAAHLEVCPCRPALCPFAGCTGSDLLHHEIPDHLGSRKSVGVHMEGLLAMLQAQQAGAIKREAVLQTQIDALKRNPRMDPFPTYTRVYQTLLRLPASAAENPSKFKWTQEYAPEMIVADEVEVGIQRFQADVFKDVHVPISKKHRRGAGIIQAQGHKLAIEVILCPAMDRDGPRAEAEVKRRELGLVVSVLRQFKAGDRTRVGTVCTDPGVYLDRFCAEFTNATNIQRHRFDVFEMVALDRLRTVEGALSAGFTPHFSICIELFEKLIPAAAQ